MPTLGRAGKVALVLWGKPRSRSAFGRGNKQSGISRDSLGYSHPLPQGRPPPHYTGCPNRMWRGMAPPLPPALLSQACCQTQASRPDPQHPRGSWPFPRQCLLGSPPLEGVPRSQWLMGCSTHVCDTTFSPSNPVTSPLRVSLPLQANAQAPVQSSLPPPARAAGPQASAPKHTWCPRSRVSFPLN